MQVKEAMKQNKLLEVALQKTESQSSALQEFLRRNRPKTDEREERDHTYVASKIQNEMDMLNQPIPEEKGVNLDNTQYDLENYQEEMEAHLEADETACEMDEKDQNELILANLNIVKNNPIPVEY